MTKEEYKSSPARASSLPLWKTNSVKLPEGMLILRDDLFFGAPEGYSDERYFKLVHRMKGLRPLPVPEGFTLTAEETTREDSDPEQAAMAFICKRLKLNYGKLSEEEKKWLKKIAQKSDLLKNPKPQRGRK